jgi:hypothetical protein
MAGASLSMAQSGERAARGRPHRKEDPTMPTVLFVVKATIPRDQEEAFNRWYNQEHVPQFLRFPGAVSARRYRAIMGEDKYQYMAVYELQDEATFQRLMESQHFKELRAEYDKHFGAVSERARFAYVQVWP